MRASYHRARAGFAATISVVHRVRGRLAAWHRYTVNDRALDVDAAPDTPLLWVLRDHLAMTGTKYGCGMALCGACTVHIDGVAVRSCVLPLQRASRQASHDHRGSVEGSQPRRAARLDRTRCAAMRLLPIGADHVGRGAAAVNPAPSDADIDAAMAGNICRCGTYSRIRKAIHRAARALAGRIDAGSHRPSQSRRRCRRSSAVASSCRRGACAEAGDWCSHWRCRRLRRPAREPQAAPRRPIQCVASDRRRRFHHHPGRSLGNGTGRVHRVADAARRGTRSRSSRIRIAAAPVGDAYVNALNGGQITGTSNSVPDAWEKLRKAGAQARIDVDRRGGADSWHIDPARCRAHDGTIVSTHGGRAAPTAQLAEAAAQAAGAEGRQAQGRGGFSPDRQTAAAARYAGQSRRQRRVRPGRAACRACCTPPSRSAPRWAARPRRSTRARRKRCRACAACSMTASGVVVVAEHFWQARKARDALRISWDPGPNARPRQCGNLRAAQRSRADRRTLGLRGDAALEGDTGSRAQERREDLRRRLRAAAGRACHHGADELHRRRQGGPLRCVCRHPGAAADASSRGRGRRASSRSRSTSTPPCSAAASAGASRWTSCRRRSRHRRRSARR